MALRKGSNYPIRVGASFAKRVQEFEVRKGRQLEDVFEMGNARPIASDPGNAEYTGTLTWNPVDNEIEERFGGKSAGTGVNLKEMMDAAGILVQSKSDGINSAKLTSLEYSAEVGGDFRASGQIRGTGWNDGDSALSATAPSGVGSYRSRSIAVVMDGARAVRVASFSVRVNVPSEDNYQMGDEDAFEITTDTPSVTGEVEFYEDTLASGYFENDVDTPKDITIGVGGTAKKIVLKNCVWTETGVRGRRQGRNTRRYSYKVQGDDTTYGLGLESNVAPTCSLAASPASIASGATTTLTATAADATGGIYRVTFYKGTTKLSEDTSAPYTHVWTGTTPGSHSFTAVAEDLFGAKTRSSVANVTVT
jgi:hypothetical protein